MFPAIVLGKYAQDEILGVVECYKSRGNLLKSGVELSHSLLLYGPPDCGKQGKDGIAFQPVMF